MTSHTLSDRGIQIVASQHGWHKTTNGYEYPTFDPFTGEKIATRFKRTSGDGAKYLWIPGKPQHEYIDWYILPNTLEAIKQAHGVVYIVNGEPSCLTHHQLGLYNTFCTTLSEVSVPSNLLPFFNGIGISRVVYLADNDDAGTTSATKWRDALAGSGIDFEALSWGDDKPAKYDSNDAWIDVQFDADAFKALLRSLEPMALPAPEPKKVYAESDAIIHDDKLVKAVHNALSVEGRFTGKTFQDGLWKQLVCPHHDDNDPTAGFNTQNGVINCFACGGVSPWETVKLYNIDTSEFITRKTPSKNMYKSQVSTKPERPEPIQLVDHLPKDVRSYEQAIDDEIMALDLAYEHGERISWIAQDDLPISWVSAMLTLAGGRSSMPAVWVKMHYALRKGTLKPFFTIKDVVDATGYDTRTVSAAIGTMQEMTFIHVLRRVSKDTLLPKENAQKGRPPQLFSIESDSDIVRSCLKEMLEKKNRVQVVNRAISMRDGCMGLQLELDDEAYEAFKKRGDVAQSEPYNKDAERVYKREMAGNGHEWKGWYKAIENEYSIPLDCNGFTNCKELRGQVALWWIEHVRDTNSRDDWKRILGCSDPTIDSVFDLVNIKTIKQTEQLEFDAPRTVKAMENLFISTQREYRGKVWKISYKIKGEKGWHESHESSYKRQFVNNLGKVEKVFMILTTPSVQALRDADEIAYLAEQEAEKEQAQVEPVEADEVEIVVSETQDEAPEPKKSNPTRLRVMPNEHVYTTYPYQWLFRQVQLDVHCFTNYKLMPDGSVFDSENHLIRKRSNLGQVVQWLNEVASDSQVRTVASFYGDDYSDEDELAELQAIERIYLFEKNYNERYAPAVIACALLDVMTHYSEVGALDTQMRIVKPKPSIKHYNFNRDKSEHVNRFAGITNKGA